MRAFHKLSQGLREDRESHSVDKSRSLRPLQAASDQISPAPATASEAQALYMRKIKQHRHMVLFIQVFLLLFIIAAWEVAADAGWLNAFIFSSPSRMIKSAAELYHDGNLLGHIGITLAETFGSFLLVAVFTILIAVLLWWNQTFSEILEPYFVILNSLPKSAMAPIFIVWLGNNMKTIIVTAISLAVFGSILNLYTSFQSTDPDKLKLIRTLHGNRIDCLTKVVLPLNLPSILSILKVDIGLCLIGVVIGEFLAAKQGLGYLIIYGSQVFKMDWVMLSIFLLCLMAAFLYKGVTWLEKHLSR